MKLYKFFLVAIVVFAFSGMAWSQDSTYFSESMGMGDFMVGMNMLDLGDLNNSLAAQGYTEMDESFFAIGGGGYGIFKNIIIGGEGTGIMTKSESSGALKTSLAGGYGLFNLGYAVVSSHNFKLYPLIGFGYGGMQLKIKDTSSIPAFDELLENPRTMSELNTDGFLFNVALGADFLQIMGRDEDGEGGIVIGARVGYMISPFMNDWKLDDADIGGGPDTGLTGFYFRLIFGGGGRAKVKSE